MRTLRTSTEDNYEQVLLERPQGATMDARTRREGATKAPLGLSRGAIVIVISFGCFGRLLVPSGLDIYLPQVPVDFVGEHGRSGPCSCCYL